MVHVIANIPLIEPVPIEDCFCLGIARIEDVGSCARFVLYSEQTCYETGGVPIWVVCRKIILPMDSIRPFAEMALDYLSRKSIAPSSSPPLRLVKD